MRMVRTMMMMITMMIYDEASVILDNDDYNHDDVDAAD